MEAISAASLVDQCATRLRRSILTGVLAPGDPFSITDIAQQLGISHVPIREALRRLEAEGLITIRPGRGATVEPLNESDLRGIYRLRKLIEPNLAYLSAPLLTEDSFRLLKHRLALLGTGDEDLDAEFTAHREFHFLLFEPAASEWDLRVLDYLWNANERYLRLMLATRDSEQQQRFWQGHDSLLSSAVSGSAEKLKGAVLQHVRHSEQSLLATVARIKEHRAAQHAP